jgi:hypothetical protein
MTALSGGPLRLFGLPKAGFAAGNEVELWQAVATCRKSDREPGAFLDQRCCTEGQAGPSPINRIDGKIQVSAQGSIRDALAQASGRGLHTRARHEETVAEIVVVSLDWLSQPHVCAFVGLGN